MKLLNTIIACTIATAVLQAADEPYRIVKDIPIGGPGGWDYISVDPAAHRLYVSHATKIVVADTETGKVVGEIPNTDGVHGFAFATDLGRGFTSNGRANTSTIVDLKTLKAIGTVATGGNPDSIRYEPVRKEVYTFNGTGKSATVFGAQTGKVVATIDLGGKPEEAEEDRGANRIFVNLEDKNSLGVIDIQKHALVATWPMPGCDGPTGLAYDAKDHLLFSACDGVMEITDSSSGKKVGSFPIPDMVDGAAFDPATGYVFAPSGTGTLTVAKMDGPGQFTVVQMLKTQPSARTMALDPVSHTVYLPAAMTQPNPSGRGRVTVGETFKVIVVGLTKR
jgi:DNA-binding beta-propeller fold protein YncE